MDKNTLSRKAVLKPHCGKKLFFINISLHEDRIGRVIGMNLIGCTELLQGYLETYLLSASLQKKTFKTDLEAVRNTGWILNDSKLHFSSFSSSMSCWVA